MSDKDNSVSTNKIRENMRKNDKFIGDILAPFEQVLGMKFNKFDKPEDPKFVEPKKKASLRKKLKQAERKQEKLKKLGPNEAKQVQWKKTIDKAKGIKVKDDPQLLKKAIKRKEAEKKKHRKNWAERKEKLEHSKKMREKKKKGRMDKARSNRRKSK